MDLPLDTAEIWDLGRFEGPRRFIAGLPILLRPEDTLVFGCYEPTPELETFWGTLGAIRQNHIEGLYTCFDFNRQNHPNGGAFILNLADDTLSRIQAAPDATLRQEDKDAFCDHVVAYRGDRLWKPLFTFHDAFAGGSLYLSGDYTKQDVEAFSGADGVEPDRIKTHYAIRSTLEGQVD